MEDKKMVSLEISGDLKEALRVEAFHRATTVSALIRQILEKELRPVMQETKGTKDKIAR